MQSPQNCNALSLWLELANEIESTNSAFGSNNRFPLINPGAMTTVSITTQCPNVIALEQKDSKSTSVDAVQVEQLYMSYSHELKAFLIANSRSMELVEVIMQDIYLKLMSIPDLSVIQNPSAYLNRLANNLLIDHYRQQERNQQRMLEQPTLFGQETKR
jgi:hypothetical protein